jgi:hypothetical protein
MRSSKLRRSRIVRGVHCNAGTMDSLSGILASSGWNALGPSTDVAPSWRRPDRVLKSAVVIDFPLGTPS